MSKKEDIGYRCSWKTSRGTRFEMKMFLRRRLRDKPGVDVNSVADRLSITGAGPSDGCVATRRQDAETGTKMGAPAFRYWPETP